MWTIRGRQQTTFRAAVCGWSSIRRIETFRGPCHFRKSVKRTLTPDIAKIAVKFIKSSTEVVQKEIEEAEHRAELRRQESEAQQQRWRHEDDQRQIAKSICDSREQLNQVIQAWAKAVSIEQFA